MKRADFVVLSLICVVTLSLAGVTVYQQLEISALSGRIEELESLGLNVENAVETGFAFLERNLWSEVAGAYHVTPSNSTCCGDDNYLAYIFHTEFAQFRNHSRSNTIKSFLQTDPPNLSLGRRRWVVLSTNFSEYRTHDDYTRYADWNALDGIFFAKTDDKTRAEYCFNSIICQMYDVHTELVKDNATSENGHEYYKIALGLILAKYLDNRTYIPIFSRRLIQLQRIDGSWLTDDLSMETTYPNTETTLLMLLALTYNSPG